MLITLITASLSYLRSLTLVSIISWSLLKKCPWAYRGSNNEEKGDRFVEDLPIQHVTFTTGVTCADIDSLIVNPDEKKIVSVLIIICLIV